MIVFFKVGGTLKVKKQRLWNKETEKLFFKEAKDFATPEQLFYTTNDKAPGLLAKGL